MLPIPVLTPDQAAAWDERAVDSGRPLRMLMETAGRAVARLLVDDHGEATRRGVLVACGKGNNGGDGWVVARTLHLLGLPVWVTEVESPSSGVASEAREAALADGVSAVAIDGPWPSIHLVVDALLGTGASGAPRPPVSGLLQRLASLDVPILALDGPTGLDLRTGADHGVLTATDTVTFGGVRRGHLLARDDVGTLTVVEIGLPGADPAWPRLVDSRWASSHFASFPVSAHKGDRGRVVILGGAMGMTGAARLAARSAFAAGAGLVHVVSEPDAIEEVRLAEPDVQAFSHPFAGRPSGALNELLARADSVVIGPGLGRAPERREFVEAVLGLASVAVIDADALTLMRGGVEKIKELAAEHHIVLTPHIGEFRTLFPDHSSELETDPWTAASEAAAIVGATVLLKGVPTVVASSDGELLTVAAGNPGLATGGSGDVLSGILGSLLARGTPPTVAAALAAQALGEAADIAASRAGVIGMRPMDVTLALAEVWRRWNRSTGSPSPYLIRLSPPVTG